MTDIFSQVEGLVMSEVTSGMAKTTICELEAQARRLKTDLDDGPLEELLSMVLHDLLRDRCIKFECGVYEVTDQGRLFAPHAVRLAL